MLAVSLALCTLVLLGVAKATQVALDRLGLDLMAVLLWLGLAETPIDRRTR